MEIGSTVRSRAGMKPLSQSRIERNGLKPGSIAPDFTLPDIYGGSVALEQYRGQRILLVFSDPHCGPCNDVAQQLVRSYRRRRPDAANIIVVSRGEREENRRKAEEHGFEFPVVIQDRWKLSRKYGIFATPVAFLIGEDGCTERQVAVGFEQIRSLLLEEFASKPVERLKETIDDISGVLHSPLPRRQAFRMAAMMAAGALLSVIGVPEAALAACSAGSTTCGTGCCATSQGLVCCVGKCCAPGQVCNNFQCTNQFVP